MKFLKVGCISLIGLFILIFAFGFFFGDTSKQVFNKKNEKVEIQPIIDATQFSKISTEELVAIMGEPQSIDEYMWLIPTTGEKIPGKTYIYENNKYDFMIIKDVVTRFNMYNEDESIKFNDNEELFALFNINPPNSFKKVADTNYALRYSSESENISDFWVLEIENNSFGIAKITYDSSYY